MSAWAICYENLLSIPILFMLLIPTLRTSISRHLKPNASSFSFRPASWIYFHTICHKNCYASFMYISIFITSNGIQGDCILSTWQFYIVSIHIAFIQVLFLQLTSSVGYLWIYVYVCMFYMMIKLCKLLKFSGIWLESLGGDILWRTWMFEACRGSRVSG